MMELSAPCLDASIGPCWCAGRRCGDDPLSKLGFPFLADPSSNVVFTCTTCVARIHNAFGLRALALRAMTSPEILVVLLTPPVPSPDKPKPPRRRRPIRRSFRRRSAPALMTQRFRFLPRNALPRASLTATPLIA